jgi:hypothetical protein
VFILYKFIRIGLFFLVLFHNFLGAVNTNEEQERKSKLERIQNVVAVIFQNDLYSGKGNIEVYQPNQQTIIITPPRPQSKDGDFGLEEQADYREDFVQSLLAEYQSKPEVSKIVLKTEAIAKYEICPSSGEVKQIAPNVFIRLSDGLVQINETMPPRDSVERTAIIYQIKPTSCIDYCANGNKGGVCFFPKRNEKHTPFLVGCYGEIKLVKDKVFCNAGSGAVRVHYKY